MHSQASNHAVIVNRDYTPYSTQRDLTIQTLCAQEKVSFLSLDDALLQPPETTLKKDGKPYTIFTPFYRNSSKLEVEEPGQFHEKDFTPITLSKYSLSQPAI